LKSAKKRTYKIWQNGNLKTILFLFKAERKDITMITQIKEEFFLA